MIDKISNEERLQKIFANVIDWLKFAETKNSMLIAFNGASIFGFTKLLDIVLSKENNHVETLGDTILGRAYVVVGITLLVASVVICLCSFVPRLRMVKGGWFSGKQHPNVLFFEYLRTRTAEEIISEVYQEAKPTISTYETHLAEQIKQIADIASKKYSFFTIGVWFTIAAFITPVIAPFFFYNVYKEVWFDKKIE